MTQHVIPQVDDRTIGNRVNTDVPRAIELPQTATEGRRAKRLGRHLRRHQAEAVREQTAARAANLMLFPSTRQAR